VLCVFAHLSCTVQGGGADSFGTSLLKANVLKGDGALAGRFNTKAEARDALASMLAIGGDVTYYLNAPSTDTEQIAITDAAVRAQMRSVERVMGADAQRSTLHSTLKTARTLTDFGKCTHIGSTEPARLLAKR
jgi:hypothetical protein